VLKEDQEERANVWFFKSPAPGGAAEPAKQVGSDVFTLFPGLGAASLKQGGAHVPLHAVANGCRQPIRPRNLRPHFRRAHARLDRDYALRQGPRVQGRDRHGV
jgi:hypothetical protein